MAKNVGFIGSIRGKVGNVVFAVSNGVQVSKAYQPVVANPKTEAQTQQRAKMALAGRLNSILPYAAIDGMTGENRRDKRGEFVKNIVRNATVFGGSSAKIEPELVMMSRGQVVREAHAVALSVARVQDFSRLADITVTLTGYVETIGQRPAGYGERIVIVAIDADTSNYDKAQTTIANLPTVGQPATTTIRMSLSGNVANFTFYAYIIPFMIASDTLPSSYSYLGNDNGIVVVVDNEVRSYPIEYGDSYMAASAVVESA